ncbi:hypothetical protein PENTCL1PPCAC_4168 [Pristionchus entomophagus]|uniref:Ribosomal protein n=1 Tax=Pristionchus entomophagus TaxID=358040 RepID=A0AAV5SG19_9BILA|nr:hypothetical protein PENTCL1PPCAC_4168 [Pristionchus entomophagus]
MVIKSLRSSRSSLSSVLELGHVSGAAGRVHRHGRSHRTGVVGWWHLIIGRGRRRHVGCGHVAGRGRLLVGHRGRRRWRRGRWWHILRRRRRHVMIYRLVTDANAWSRFGAFGSEQTERISQSEEVCRGYREQRREYKNLHRVEISIQSSNHSTALPIYTPGLLADYCV